jgi:hypothetical protein
MFTALALMVASGAVYAAPLASNFYREAMPQSWRGSWCETAPEAFTRCAHEHSDITITAAGFYDHETNCEHVQIIAPVRRSEAWLNINGCAAHPRIAANRRGWSRGRRSSKMAGSM